MKRRFAAWLAVAVLLSLIFSVASSIIKLKSISVETLARKNMQEAADTIDQFISEQDSLDSYITREKIFQKLLQAGLNRFGIPFVMDDSTRFIAHPLGEMRTLLEVGYDNNNKALIELSYDVINGRPFEKDYWHINTITKQWSNEALLRMTKTGLLLGMSIYDGKALESAEYQTTLRHYYIVLILLCGTFFILLCRILMKDKAVFAYPVILLAMLTGIISSYNYSPLQSNIGFNSKFSFSDEQKWDMKRLISQSSLDAFIMDYRQKSEKMYSEQPRIIPTGLYIHNADFTNPYTIRLVGTLWQKYLISTENYPKEIADLYFDDEFDKKGIFTGAYVENMEPTDTVETMMGDYPIKLYRWNFDIEIVQKLSYSLYPFGNNEIMLMLSSNDFDSNVILTPDLDSYKQLYPTDQPGLGNNFNLKRWNIYSSYYAYAMESYLCSFGNIAMQGINQYPELTFKIVIKRKFGDLLIGKVIPLMIVLLLLFTILFVRIRSDGFNNIIGCSGLFFVLMLDHINLRESVSADQIMFFEYCYFLSYTMLLLIAITSFDIFKRGESHGLVVDTIIKRYFWTVGIGAMMLIAAVHFW